MNGRLIDCQRKTVVGNQCGSHALAFVLFLKKQEQEQPTEEASERKLTKGRGLTIGAMKDDEDDGRHSAGWPQTGPWCHTIDKE